MFRGSTAQTFKRKILCQNTKQTQQGSCPSCGSPSHTGSHTPGCPKNNTQTDEGDERLSAEDVQESETQRGLPKDFQDKVENLQFQKDIKAMSYGEAIDQIQQMARGANPDGLRIEYYEGWNNEDFVELLKKLDES